jgi:hypothetical protein
LLLLLLLLLLLPPPSQWIVLGASRDSAKRPISAFMPLCKFLLADRLAPEALRPLASQPLFGDPLRMYRTALTYMYGQIRQILAIYNLQHSMEAFSLHLPTSVV